MSNENKVIIEIPKNSNIKYEVNPKGQIEVDRILYGANVYPHNYGYFENTLDWDGDPLDILVISDQSFMPGVHVPTRILGAMKMIDGGETDTKLIGVISCDPRYDHVKSMSDVPAHTLAEIRDFFENYKNLQNKKVVISGFEGKEWAMSELEECTQLSKKYSHMSKKEFIKLMMEKHPEKYSI